MDRLDGAIKGKVIVWETFDWSYVPGNLPAHQGHDTLWFFFVLSISIFWCHSIRRNFPNKIIKNNVIVANNYHTGRLWMHHRPSKQWQSAVEQKRRRFVMAAFAVARRATEIADGATCWGRGRWKIAPTPHNTNGAR